MTLTPIKRLVDQACGAPRTPDRGLDAERARHDSLRAEIAAHHRTVRRAGHDPCLSRPGTVVSWRERMERSATISACRQYRYSLWRNWRDPLSEAYGYAMFVGLNPGTADETTDDPTIRRCISFARAWGYEGLCMTNIFAFRATYLADMLAAADPIGPANDQTLRDLAEGAGVIVAAWGVHGSHLGRDADVRAMLPRMHYLRLTKAGYPGHPLYYLPKTLTPTEWLASNEAVEKPAGRNSADCLALFPRRKAWRSDLIGRRD